MDLKLLEGCVVSELSHHVHGATVRVTEAIAEVLADLLVPVDNELFVDGWVEVRCMRELLESLHFSVHLFHEEEGVVYLKRRAVGELLNALLVHVLRVLQEQLEVLRVLGLLSDFLARALGFRELYDLGLVLLKVAVFVGTGVFVMVDVSFQHYGTFSVLVLGLDQVQEIPDLQRNVFSSLKVIDVLQQYL